MSESERGATSGHEHPVKGSLFVPMTEPEETNCGKNEEECFVRTVNAVSPAKAGEGKGDGYGNHDDIEHAVRKEPEAEEGQGGENERHRHAVDGAGGRDDGANAIESVGRSPVGGGVNLHTCI